MNTYALVKGRRAQIFVTVIIVLAIVLALGAAVLFHSRSFRDITRIQLDSDQAYSLAKSGIGIGELYVEANPLITSWEQTYNFLAATVKIEITQDLRFDYPYYYGVFWIQTTGTITSTGRTSKSIRILKRPYNVYSLRP